MHGAGAVKMWKRLVVCVGVCGYLVVVMVARSTMEGTPSHRVPEGTTGRHYQGAPQEESTIWIRQGTPPVTTKVITSPDERQPWNAVNDKSNSPKGNTVGLGRKMVSISAYFRERMSMASEPVGFVSQNNSMKPLFVMIRSESKTASKVNGGAYGDVFLVKRRYLSQNLLTEPHVASAKTHAVVMSQRQGFVNSMDLLYKSRLPLLPSHLTVTPSPEREFCDASFAHRRMRSVCRANPRATECHARPQVCNPHLCHMSEDDGTGSPPPFLLVLIHSHPSHGYRRDAIRDTWGAIVKDYQRNLRQRIVFLFLLGSSTSLDESRAVTRELSLYRDIAQYELRDTYNNLTVKSVLALDWIRAFCSDVTYVLKTDDDAFMNISNIVTYLKTTAPQSGVLLGSMHPKSAVQRTGQWQVAREIYPATTYPPYCSGTAYVMTSDVARALYSAHYDATYRDAVLLPMEDVYVTGLLPSRLRLTCNHSEPFPNWTTGPSPRSVGKYLRSEVLGVHGMSSSGMYGLYKLVTQCATCRTNATTLRKWFALLTGAT